MARMRGQLLVSAVLVALVVGSAAGQQAATGTVAGRVTDQSSKQPIPAVQFVIVGTTRGTTGGDDGTYRLANVVAGERQIRVRRVGYQEMIQRVTIVPGQAATLDFSLVPTAIKIDEVVISATGESERKRERGNSTATIDVAEQVSQAVVNTLPDVLSSRVAGVVVQQSGGTTGSGARIRIRGANSVSLSNDPLIIVDGIRVNSSTSSSSIDVGGQAPSRLNDLNPEDIETIEVIKGPAASALYGTAAANGVVQITTKRGRPGTSQWTAHTELGTVREVTNYPANYSAVEVSGTDTTFGTPNTTFFGCTLDFRSRGFCTPTGLASFNPLKQQSPFTKGYQEKYGLTASGGSDAATYFLSGEFNKQQGVYAINQLRALDIRANIRGQLRDNLDVTANTGYIQSRLRLPQNDNNIRGIIPGGLLGSAFKDNGTTRFNEPLNGYGFDSPADIMAINTQQKIERFIGSLTTNWQALQWLKLTNTSGIDFTNRLDQETIPALSSGVGTSGFADDQEGKRTSNPFQLFVYTLNTNATATFDLKPTVRSTTSLGVQFNDEIVRGTLAFGQRLLAGSSTIGGAATLFAANETNTENRLIGGYAQQQIGWRDRVFLTGALRGDKNSAFGKSFTAIYYPAASVSWVIGDESFFPRQRFVSSLRVRSAYGESGQRPGVRDAIKFYNPVAVTVNNQDAAGFTVGGIGNIKLKPERTSEFEGGFDAGLFRDRINLEFTAYKKRTLDALILRNLGPSQGNVLSRFENLGEVSNKGVELLVNGKVLDRPRFAWDVTLNGSWNVNKVVNLGQDIKPIVFGANSDQRHQNGFPLGAYFVRPITSYEDKDKNGFLSRVNCPGQPVVAGGPACEITLGDSALYAGSPFPTREFAISSRVTLFKRFTFNAVVDHRGGQKLLNFTEYFRCASFANCYAANVATSPKVDQVAYLAALMGSDAGYVQDASFTKLRELSLRVDVPEALSRKVRVRGLALTVAGRNLHTWTNYKGLDPEINENGQSNFVTDEFLSQPLVRFWTFRLDINW